MKFADYFTEELRRDPCLIKAAEIVWDSIEAQLLRIASKHGIAVAEQVFRDALPEFKQALGEIVTALLKVRCEFGQAGVDAALEKLKPFLCSLYLGIELERRQPPTDARH
jgi:hypothetical protein